MNQKKLSEALEKAKREADRLTGLAEIANCVNTIDPWTAIHRMQAGDIPGFTKWECQDLLREALLAGCNEWQLHSAERLAVFGQDLVDASQEPALSAPAATGATTQAKPLTEGDMHGGLSAAQMDELRAQGAKL